jgi:tRNA U38,U39,U40 pseudouridine synthase TruA
MSYHGPAFNGIKKDMTVNSLRNKHDITTVLNDSLLKFNRGKIEKVIPVVRCASRTDIGVHAVRNAFTFNTTMDNS